MTPQKMPPITRNRWHRAMPRVIGAYGANLTGCGYPQPRSDPLRPLQARLDAPSWCRQRACGQPRRCERCVLIRRCPGRRACNASRA